jgi:hypothetical protein
MSQGEKDENMLRLEQAGEINKCYANEVSMFANFEKCMRDKRSENLSLKEEI